MAVAETNDEALCLELCAQTETPGSQYSSNMIARTVCAVLLTAFISNSWAPGVQVKVYGGRVSRHFRTAVPAIGHCLSETSMHASHAGSSSIAFASG